MGGLSDVIKGNDTVLQMANMNNSVRAGMDLMVRDLLQVGSGLPAGHAVTIPNGAGSRRGAGFPALPGPTSRPPTGDITLPAVMPGPRQGPTINGVQTDAITVLMADNTFLDVGTDRGHRQQSSTVAGPAPTCDDRRRPGDRRPADDGLEGRRSTPWSRSPP